MRRKKALGQHFLHDPTVLRRICEALELETGEQIVEIGPGTGRLTKRLVADFGSACIDCVERDPEMIAHLAEKLPDVRVHYGDATKYPFDELVAGPSVVCGNLPYNVSTGIYFHLLLNHGLRFRRMVLMFQREVARRLIAPEGSKTYGPPSVITNIVAKARSVMVVRPRSFRPPPRVDSQVIVVDPYPVPRYGLEWSDIPAVNAFVRGLFKHRRKTVQNNLKTLIGAAAPAALERCAIDPRLRPEVLAPVTLVDLWRAVIGQG